MALKATLTAEDFAALDEGLKAHYIQDNDQYILDTDNRQFKARIDEFRNNNIDLMNKVEELKQQVAKFGDIDVNEYKELKKKASEAHDKVLLDEGKIDELIQRRTENMRNDYEAKLAAIQRKFDDSSKMAQEYRDRLERTTVENKIAEAVQSVGVLRKGALQDVLSRARGVWRLNDDGRLVAMNGDMPVYGSNPPNPISPEEWSANLLNEAPYFFERSSGAGSNGSGRQSGNQGNQLFVSKGDHDSISRNIEGIASGKVQVRDPYS